MRNKFLLSCLTVALLGGTACENVDEVLDLDRDSQKSTKFTVRVENVSQPQTLEVERLNGIVPLSPGVFAVYPGNAYPATNPLFLMGSPADEGTERIAEDGLPMMEAQILKNYPALIKSGTFDSPGGPDNDLAILPGEHASFTIHAKPGDRLQLETMFVQSNDWFYGFGQKGLELFHGATPVSGDVTEYLVLYDAGTEEDTPPGTGPYQRPVHPMTTDVGPADNYPLIAPARERHEEFMIPANHMVIKVTITPHK
jgi:hypothetical protein